VAVVVYRAGQAFYWAPGHAPEALEDAEFLEISPTEGVRALHAHVSEQPAENEDCTAAYGRTPVEVLAGAGLVGGRFTAVHATHLTATDVTTPATWLTGSASATPNTIAAPVRSLWQTDCIGVRMLLDVNWGLRRTGVVAWTQTMTWN
jgi:cytosine/adenosine deaminase-related metal-dependent hydrolase